MNYGCCTVCKEQIADGVEMVVTGITINNGLDLADENRSTETNYAHAACCLRPRTMAEIAADLRVGTYFSATGKWPTPENLPAPSGEFSEAIRRRLEYKHLSDFGYKVAVELGCEFQEEMLGLNHFRITVPGEYVEAVKKLAYEYTSVITKIEVVARDINNHVRDAVEANR